MSKSDLIRLAIKNCTDEAELEKLEKELVKAVEEEALAKAKVQVKKEMEEAAAKAAAEKKEKEELETQKAVDAAREANKGAFIPDGAQITVGTPQMYKGVNLKGAIDALQNHGMVPAHVRRAAIQNPARAEQVCKFMIGVMDKANGVAPDAAKSMNEGTTTAGGYLTPTEERMAVLSYIRDTSIALADCAHIPMASDSTTMPRENGKVNVNYTDEESDATSTSAVFDQVTLTAKRMDAYVDVSNELIQDAAIPGGIAGLLAGQFLEAVGQKIDSTVFLGTGSPVSGIFKNAGTSEVFSSGSTAFSALLESNLRNVMAKIRPNRRANTKWYMSATAWWTIVKNIKDTNGKPLYDDYTAGQVIEAMLLGKPVREGNDDIMPSTSAAATGFIVLGDLSGFLIGDRLTNVSLMENPYLLMTSNQTRFHLFTRWAFAHGLPQNYSRIVTAAS